MRAKIATKLFSVVRPAPTQPAVMHKKAIHRRCPYCAAVRDNADEGQCHACRQKVDSVARANNDRDAALSSTDPARKMAMVQKLATFKALSDADVGALLQVSAHDQSGDLQSEAQVTLMHYFNISVDDTYYRYQTYRYDRFEYAVAYAKQDMDKARLAAA